MKVNQKAIKVLDKLFEAKYTNERAISSLTIDQILALKGVSVADIAMINELQKKIKVTIQSPQRNPQFLHKNERWKGTEKNQRNVNIQEGKKVVC